MFMGDCGAVDFGGAGAHGSPCGGVCSWRIVKPWERDECGHGLRGVVLPVDTLRHSPGAALLVSSPTAGLGDTCHERPNNPPGGG